MDTVESWAREDQLACKQLLESMGFKLVRVFSAMKRDLNAIPSDISENKNMKIRKMEKSTKDIELLNWINNETFKDHFDFRPTVVQEWEHWCSEPDFNPDGWFFALLDNKIVWYVGTWIDSEFIKQKGIKKGWIDAIGVLKPYGRKGIGTALILRAMDFLKGKGMTEVELGVDDANPTGAIELYKKAGFKVIRKELTYLKTLLEVQKFREPQ